MIVQQWFDSLADLVSPMSPLGSCKVLVQQWFDSLADLVSPMSPLSFRAASGPQDQRTDRGISSCNSGLILWLI